MYLTLLWLCLCLAPLLNGPLAAEANAEPSWAADPHARIVRVSQDSLVTIPFNVLAASGWDLRSVDPATIRVVRQGFEVPIQISAAGVQFVATASDAPSTSTAAYWLTYGGTAGLRAPLPVAPAAPLRWEVDALYQSIAPTARGDRWFAGELRTGGAPLSATVTLPASVPAGTPLEIALTALEPSASHRLSVSANGASIGAVQWHGAALAPQIVTLALPALPAGPLTLELTLTSPTSDAVLIDALTFPTVAVPLPHITVTSLERPVGLPDLAAVESLVVTHASFLDALAPLIAARQARGIATAVVDVQAVYDAFSWGERDPEAIRAMLRAARPSSPELRSALLVGAGTVRLRDDTGAEAALIPPYLLDIDPKYGAVACDSCYGRLNDVSPTAQLVPDLAIGRLPVRTLEEAQVVVAKTVAALGQAPGGNWQSRALIVADNDAERDGTPDRAAPFGPLVDQTAAGLPGMQVERFVYAPGQAAGEGRYPSAASLRAALLPAWDSGAAVVAYVGHASPWQWAATGPDEATPFLLDLYDADARANSGRLPILLNLSCLSGAFANPTLPTTDERLLLHAGGGIAAALSPAGSGVNTGHAALLEGSLPSLSAGASLGEAALSGMQRLAATGRDRDLLYSYNILGDPELALPRSFEVALPLVTR